MCKRCTNSDTGQQVQHLDDEEQEEKEIIIAGTNEEWTNNSSQKTSFLFLLFAVAFVGFLGLRKAAISGAALFTSRKECNVNPHATTRLDKAVHKVMEHAAPALIVTPHTNVEVTGSKGGGGRNGKANKRSNERKKKKTWKGECEQQKKQQQQQEQQKKAKTKGRKRKAIRQFISRLMGKPQHEEGVKLDHERKRTAAANGAGISGGDSSDNKQQNKRSTRQRRTKGPNSDGSIDEIKKALLVAIRRDVDNFPGLRERAIAVKVSLDDATLLRYLVVAYWKLDVHGTPLVNYIEETIIWRETYGPHRITIEEVAYLGTTMHIYVNGHDREGMPIIYLRPGWQDVSNFDTEASLRLLIFNIETALRQMPAGQEKFAVLVDCQGFGLSKLPPVSYVKQVFKILMKQYPMRLGYVRLVRAGGAMNLAWKLISTVLEERTTDKVAFVQDDKVTRELISKVHPSVLEQRLGGESTNYPTSESYYGLVAV